MTVREAVMAMEAGADILKVFPGDVFGPKIIKAIRGPIPYAKTHMIHNNPADSRIDKPLQHRQRQRQNL